VNNVAVIMITVTLLTKRDDRSHIFQMSISITTKCSFVILRPLSQSLIY